MASIQLTYFIGLTSKAEVLAQQAINHVRADGRRTSIPGLVYRAPLEVSTTFAAPIVGWAETGGPGPYTYSEFFSPTAGGAGGAYPQNVATFTRKPGGFWGWVGGLFGWGTKTYYWVGMFKHITTSAALEPGPGEVGGPDPGGADPVPAKEPIAQRRWIDGFEAPGNGAGGSGALEATYASVDASRHLSGYGVGMRSVTNSTCIRLPNEFGLANSASDWERLYIRVRKRPVGGGRFWHSQVTGGSGGAGISLEIMPTGAIAIYQHTSTASFTLLGATSPALTVDQWYRLDMVITAPPVCTASAGATCPHGVANFTAGNGTFTLYIGGRVAFTGSISPTIIAHLAVSVHDQTHLGSTITTNGLELDLDDWICVAGLPTRNTLDWRNGSAVMPVRATAFGSGHANWTGDVRVLTQRPTGAGADQYINSSTALARLEIDTDAALTVDAVPGTIGIAGLIVSLFGTRGTTSGTLGYKIGAAAEVLTAITQGVVAQWNRVLYTISGISDPTEIVSPLKLIHVKGNDVSAALTYTLTGQAECIGKFGIEDELGSTTFRNPVGIHNWPYPRSPWGTPSANAPVAPLAIYYGQYVGTGTGVGEGGQDISFPTPIHWFWCRPTTAGHVGTHWWSTMMGAHVGTAQSVKPAALAFQVIDSSYIPGGAVDSQQTQSTVRLGGNNAQANANGVTYQYIAVSDPGMRFMLNGAISRRGTGTETNALLNSLFTAQAAWIWPESFDTSGTAQHSFKGPGNTAASYQKITAAEIANAITFAAGSLSTQSAFHQAVNQIAYSLWRANDNSDDPKVADVVGIGSYTGDGAASRTIGVSPASTKSPLFVWVQSRTAPGGGFWRDPMHTTTGSSDSGGNATATAITAGDISSFTVGSSLNTTGQVYSYFVIWGTATPGGWTPAPAVGPPLVIVPVEPIEPIEPGPFPLVDDPSEDPGLDPIPPEPEPGDPIVSPGVADDLADCPIPTVRLANRALANIGHSIRVEDLLTEETEEAEAIRLHFDDDARTVLAAFPWPFATKYLTLTLVGGSVGTPVNGDWRYSYRQPADCVFERRIVVARNGAVDPTPPPFQLGHDATGVLIFTNQAAAVLEYTARVPCVAEHGDPLFLEALSWKLAASIAPALTRMPEKEATALERFGQIMGRVEQVVRPGNPGAPPTVDGAGPDIGAGCGQANTDAVNRALIRIGARTITSLSTDQSREASTARAIFEAELRSTLRDFDWPFATAYNAALALVDGAIEDQANADWVYSYRLPSAVLKVRRLSEEVYGRSGLETAPYAFRVGRDATGALLYTNQEAPVIEYTYRPNCALGVADDLFKDAFSWRLAFSLAPSLATVNPETPEQMGRAPEPQGKERPATQSNIRERAQRTAWAMYQLTLSVAKAAAANEQQRDLEGPDADWHRGR